MRPRFRIAALLAFVAAITCTEAPTAPSRSRDARSTARIALAPSFGADAARAYRGLLDFGFDVASVHIRLTATDGTLAKDTVISFPAAQDTLRVDLSVAMEGSEQNFTALLELRDASGRALFSGSRLVTARTGSLPGVTPPAIPLEYSGPGRDARTLSLVPGDGTRSASDVISLAASGLDSAGRPVSDLLVRWTSDDAALGALTTTGDAAAELHGAGKRGTVVITAVSPTGLTASTRLSLVPPAARLVSVGGDAQSGIAGRALAQPFVVELQAADGGPVPNAAITFRAVSAGGAVATRSATTDTAGRASTALTLGRTAGAYTFDAVYGGIAPARVTATATPAPPAALAIVSGDAQTDSIGQPLAQPLVVRVVDEFGAPVAGATVDWTVLAGTGVTSAAHATSDTLGLASVRYTLGAVPHVDSVRASLAGGSASSLSAVFTETATPRAAASIQIRSGGGQQGVVNATLPAPLVAFVSDALGNAVSGVTVCWTASGISAVAFAPTQSVTDADGLAQTTVTLGARTELVTAVATAGSLSATTPLIAIPGNPSSFLLLQALPSTILVGMPPANALRVQLADAAGNPTHLAGLTATVTAKLAQGKPAPAPVSSTSDSAGVVTFNLPAYVGAADSATFTVTAPGFAPLVTPTITFAKGPIALMRIATQPTLSATNGSVFTVQPAVQLEDAGGNPVAVSGVKVTAYVASGGGVLGGTVSVDTDSTGLAVFTDLSITASAGLKTLGFKSGSLPDVLSSQIDLASTLVPTALYYVADAAAPMATAGR